MIFIALAILVGILWTGNPILSICSLLFTSFLVWRKKVSLFFILILICSSIFSFLYLEHINRQERTELNFITQSKVINQRIAFLTYTSNSPHTIKGKILFNYQQFPYFISKTDNNKTYHKSLAGYSCIVKGTINADNPSHTFIKLNSVKLNSCYKQFPNYWVQAHKHFILQRLKQSGLIDPYRIIALINGDTSQIDEKLKESIKEIGIYHLLAVSGSHIVAIIYLIYQPLVRFNIPLLLIRILIIIVLLLFAMYTDYAPSAVRAILMGISLMLLPRKLFNTIDLLSIAFILMFLFNPMIVYDIGFQFSFIISLFIILSLPYLNTLSKFHMLLAVTGIAQIASSIVSMIHFNQIQWIGLLTNIIFVPLYTFVIFPLALLIFIISHLTLHISLLNKLINIIFHYHDQLVLLFLKLNKIRWFIPDLNLWLQTLIVILIVCITIALVHKKYILMTLTLIITIFFLIIIPANDKHTKLTMLDVGQGDSILFEERSNINILIDTGGKAVTKGEDHHNIAKYHILPSLKSKGITKIDYLILTHPHQDHIGELPYIIEHIKIKHIIFYKQGYPQHTLENIVALCKMHHVQIHEASTLSSLQIGESHIQFLNSYIPTSDDKNEYSIVMLLKYHKKTILLMGDATKNNEDILLRKYNLPHVDILKVGHHGSKTSSSVQFISKIKPKISLISSGKNNRYHLPNKEIVSRLINYGSKVLNTQSKGEVTIDLDMGF